jgi:N6-L-threonylcarbamoyladenine synthase
MKILGIETSCDETAAAVVENGVKVLSNVIASQINLHKKTGGVVPEVAAREHILKIIPVIKEALKKANTKWGKIDAIAAVPGPGLITALLTGTLTASTLALIKKKPLISVHHIIGHIYGNWLERNENKIKFPIIVLTVSGGHNDLILMEKHNNFKLLGTTRDDAAGEAFDKVAKLLGLSYPGGPAIQKAALKGDPNKFLFPKAHFKDNSLDYSFSGLKTAVLYEIQKIYGKNFNPSNLSNKLIYDIAASFQKTVTETLIDNLLKAVENYSPKEVHLAGGVSANISLRNYAEKKLKKFKIPIRYPKKIEFCTDNAAMIASCAYFMYKTKPAEYKHWQNIQANTDFTF